MALDGLAPEMVFVLASIPSQNCGGKLLLGIVKESAPGETRVALLPESLKSLLTQGIAVRVEAGAGLAAGAADAAYIEVGAAVSADRAQILADADVLPMVNAPNAADQARLRPGAVVIGFLKPLDAIGELTTAIARPVTLFSMELVPRISRAQSMDALSSMATVAGYKAVISAADKLPRLFPMSDDRRRDHSAGAGFCDRRGCRRLAGHCYRATPGRGGRSI